ncbi:peroxisomal biogenesis factor 11ab isoform X2 [Lycorma delicatula]
MEQRNANKKSVEKLKQIEYTFSTFRKILRLGRCIDVLYSSLTTINYTEPMVRLTSTLSKITNGLYLLCDHVLWAARAGLADINTAEWGTTANRYWLFSIYCNLIRDVYEIFRIISLYNNKVNKSKSIKTVCGYSQNTSRITYNNYQSGNKMLLNILSEHKDVVLDTVKNSCDVFIPLTSLGFVKLSPGTIGMLGTISSIISIIVLIDPLSKLTPS